MSAMPDSKRTTHAADAAQASDRGPAVTGRPTPIGLQILQIRFWLAAAVQVIKVDRRHEDPAGSRGASSCCLAVGHAGMLCAAVACPATLRHSQQAQLLEGGLAAPARWQAPCGQVASWQRVRVLWQMQVGDCRYAQHATLALPSTAGKQARSGELLSDTSHR